MQGMFTVTTDGNLEEALLQIAFKTSTESLISFMQFNVDPYMRRRAQNRFAHEGDDAVGHWKQLRPATVRWREDEGYPGQHPINRRSGELEDLLTNRDGSVIGSGASGAVWRAMSAVPGGELGKKLRTAQMGRAKPHTVPRPVLGMNEEDMGAVLAMLHTHVMARFE